ncbi:MAG: tRNA (cytidine(34)-2'-O)-methyltransferase [Gammaproteobacteria bacterium]|nr:tRNA (cytidine(34)-2'-O)-methyltransferase [Gammaproteobacteria bacterium]
MLDIVLYQPEIPPNTGSIMRIAANTGAGLALIEPLGFELDNVRLRRAGLDYREYADVRVYPCLGAYLERARPPRVFAFSARARVPHTEVAYRAGDALLFGPESRGLPGDVLESVPPDRRLRIPMRARSRSLNLSNAVAVAVYEAWRQLDFR